MDKTENTIIVSKSDEDEYNVDLKRQGFSKVDEIIIAENRAKLEGLNW